jgi:parallel beta-helix repeat protein
MSLTLLSGYYRCRRTGNEIHGEAKLHPDVPRLGPYRQSNAATPLNAFPIGYFLSRFLAVLLTLLIAIAAVLPGHAIAKIYYVDAKKGDDTWPGDEDKPLRSIARASELLVAGDKALIREGVYHEQIMGGRSGTREEPIVYEGVSRSKVILRGSVHVTDWERNGNVWVKRGIDFKTSANAFVMVDEKKMLKRTESLRGLVKGTFHLAADGSYTIRLWNDEDPNRHHRVEVYKLDFAFNSGDEWGGTAKKWIILRNLTLEKYGTYGISTDCKHPGDNSHWELDRITVRYNNAEGVFHCLDDWFVHDCCFVRNLGHGCQLNGARIRFTRNFCAQNEWFGVTDDGGCGILIGPDATGHSCVVKDNVFMDNGDPNGYGCGIYLEGRSHDNHIENNLFIRGTSSGIGFFGSSRNTVVNNLFVNIAPGSEWRMAAAFAVDHSIEGAPTQSAGNLVAHNTVWGCPAPLAVPEPSRPLGPDELNRFVNNLFVGCGFLWPLSTSPVVDLQGNGFFSCPKEVARDRQSLKAWLKNLRVHLQKERFIGYHRNNLFGPAPGLTDPANGDYRPKPGSPLIDAGIQWEGLGRDRHGNKRPYGRAPDIGAYEFVPVSPERREIHR